MAMQGIPVAKVNAVPKVNAIDKIDSLSSPLSKKILLSRTKNEEHSFAKLLARAQGKKIDAQVSDEFSSSNGFHESKRASADLRRKDAAKTKPRRNEGTARLHKNGSVKAKDAVKKETIDAAKDVVKKQYDGSASSDINERKSLEHTLDENRGRMADAADEALEKTEVLDAGDAARTALLEDFAYLVDGTLDSESAGKGIDTKTESDTDDFFAESVSAFEDIVSYQTEAGLAHATMTANGQGEDGGTESGGFSDDGFSAEPAFSFGAKDETAATKREHTFDADGKILVTDLRTEISESVSEVKPESEDLIKLDAANGASSDMTMFVSEGARQNVSPANAQSTQTASANFQAMLANQIRQNASDFVRAGSIVLRDNNAGTINLVLRPESLGNVKISLQLSDKVVSGQITVQSEEAYNAFKESADALKTAFAQSGFEAGGFTVAYSSAGTGGSFSGSGTDGSFADAQHAGRYESAFVSEVSAASGGSYIGSEHAVNVVV